jgi:dTDP-4-dehydrorhamnose 3,5-epimerase
MSFENILVTPLRRIEVVGGDVLHAMRSGDEGFSGFGEAYFSSIAFNTVKAWKRHLRMTMNLLVPAGQVRFVFHVRDLNGVAHFQIQDIGEGNYARITVPPGIWFGFKGMATQQSLVLNIASIPHDPLEVERIGSSEINYSWEN